MEEVTGNEGAPVTPYAQENDPMTVTNIPTSPPPTVPTPNELPEYTAPDEPSEYPTESNMFEDDMVQGPEAAGESTQEPPEYENVDAYDQPYPAGPQGARPSKPKVTNQNFRKQMLRVQRTNQIIVQISMLPVDRIDERSTALRCQGMHFIEGLTLVDPSLWDRHHLLRICITSIFALPPLDALQSPRVNPAVIQEQYNRMIQGMEAMLKRLLLRNPNTDELIALLDHFLPWMKSGQAHERARAMNAYVFLLKCAASTAKFEVPQEFPRLGFLVAQLCVRLNDPDRETGKRAMEGLYYLYYLSQRQKYDQTKRVCMKEKQLARCKDILGLYDPTKSQQNLRLVVREFEQPFTTEQLIELLITSLDYLRDDNRSIVLASQIITVFIMEKYKQKLGLQVSEIVNRVYQQLAVTEKYQDREILMKPVCQLAHIYLEAVCMTLLKYPNPADRFASEMWYALAKSSSNDEVAMIVNILLKEIQQNPNTTGNYTMPLAASIAFCKVLSVPQCSDLAVWVYPRLLMSLLVQIHYNIKLNIVWKTGTSDLLEPVSYVIAALKTLLLSVRCYREFTAIEKEGGWKTLTSCENHHRGVGIVARAMLKNSCESDLLRILYLLVPFLERGDEEHQVTAMAFFVELLSMPAAKRLPKQYSLNRMSRGLMHPNPVIRALCIKGLVKMAGWTGKEVKALLPIMVKALSEMDGLLFVESVTEFEKVLLGVPDEAPYISSITFSLQEHFNDKRQNVRGFAINLFGKMVKKSKRNDPVMKSQILENLVPILLHFPEDNLEVTESCKYALIESLNFLGWRLIKQISAQKSWYDYEDVVYDICQFLVNSQEENLQKYLYQGLFYTGSEFVFIKRASIIYLGFLVAQMEEREKVDMEMVLQCLEGLMYDLDASVCIAAAQVHANIFAILNDKKEDNLAFSDNTKKTPGPSKA